eukprot:g28823.t1
MLGIFALRRMARARQYTHSLRWAFSQLGIGGTNIEAVNEAEGLYSVVVALVSLITFSSIISSMTSLVSITRFLHYTYHQRSANVDDPYILDFLSKSLQAELQLARYNDYLSKMPFLAAILKRSNTLSLQEGHVLQTLASQAISSHDFAEDDVLFCYGNRATAAYYERTARSPPHELWICEMCLWTRWTHLGDLLSTSFCKILAVHGKARLHCFAAPAFQGSARICEVLVKLGEAYEADTRFRKAPGCVKLTSCTPPFLHSQPGLQRFSRSTSNLGSAPGTPADNKRLTRAESARSGALEKSGENEPFLRCRDSFGDERALLRAQELQRSLESSFESIAPVEQRASFVRQGSTPMDMAPDSTSAVPLPSVPLDCWLHRAKTNGTRITKRTVEEAAEVKATLRWNCTLTVSGVSASHDTRNVWDFLGIILLLTDAITLPLLFVNASFFEDFPAVAMGSSAVTVGYWTMDVVLSFFTGYLQKGNLILNHGDIARHYLRLGKEKSWFLPDFLVTTIDIVLTFSGAETDRASTRILRLLRLFRVVRLGKLTRFVAFVRDKFESETAYTQFSLMLLIAGMMLLEHVVACGWLGIGSLTSEPETWTTRYRAEAAAFTVKYTHSLRWAFSQLGIGGTNIEAVNEPEGLYSVVVALVSLITFSTIISSMTSLVSTLQSKRMEQTQQFGLLRRFLRLNKIPEGLGSRVTRFLHYTYQERALNSGDPYILDYLSKSLQAELLLARYRQQLSKMAFFKPLLRNKHLSLQESKTLQTLASQGVSMHDVAEDDVIFCSGHTASYSYFVANGSMLYLQSGDHERFASNDSWIAEMCLWSTWTHVGDLMCHSFCKVLAINVTEMGIEVGKKRSSVGSLGVGPFGNPLRFFDRLPAMPAMATSMPAGRVRPEEPAELS